MPGRLTPAGERAIRERAAAATPGPWRRSPGSGAIVASDESGGDVFVAAGTWPHTGDFIAATRDDVPALLAELDAVRAERGALLDAIEYAVNAWDDGDMHRGAIDGLRAPLDAARPDREAPAR